MVALLFMLAGLTLATAASCKFQAESDGCCSIGGVLKRKRSRLVFSLCKLSG